MNKWLFLILLVSIQITLYMAFLFYPLATISNAVYMEEPNQWVAGLEMLATVLFAGVMIGYLSVKVKRGRNVRVLGRQ